MTDRELLILAAKAVGIALAFSSVGDISPRRADTWDSWNPLADDGDALRLAVKLRMALDIGEDGMVKTYAQHAIQGHGEDIGDDPYADTRRAIVRSAAEIGRQGKD